MNCRSLRSEAKRNELNTIIETHQPHIIHLQETHLDKSIPTSERQFIVRIASSFWLSWVELIDVLLPVDMLEVFMSSTRLFVIGVGWHVWPLCNVWFIVSFCLHFGHDHIMLSHLHILLYSTGLILMWTQCSQLSHDIAHQLVQLRTIKIYLLSLQWTAVVSEVKLRETSSIQLLKRTNHT
jgi:hypothetical protein